MQPQAVPNPLLSITPDRGRCPPDGTTEIELSLVARAPGVVATVLELEVCGGKPIKIPVR